MVTKKDYIEYLISTPVNYTCTNFAKHLEDVSHDAVNDYLHRERLTASQRQDDSKCSEKRSSDHDVNLSGHNSRLCIACSVAAPTVGGGYSFSSPFAGSAGTVGVRDTGGCTTSLFPASALAGVPI